ncbi:MAG: MarR family transcriptional regulator [Betaproteobacteria bacterium]|nr:MarR family transcriptional regulator [Betaproteobacteria bacterium]
MLPSPPPIYRRAQKGREKREFTVTTYLAGLTGSEVAEAVLLFLSREDDSFSAFVSRYTGYGHQAIGAQLRRLESAGVVVRKNYGRAVFYSFDRSKPWIPPLIESIKSYYNSLRPEEKQAMFMRKPLNSPLRSHSKRLNWLAEEEDPTAEANFCEGEDPTAESNLCEEDEDFSSEIHHTTELEEKPSA